MFYNIQLSNYKRDHVIDYVKEQKELNPEYKVLDIGGSANYTNWCYDIIDYVVDFNDCEDERIKQFKFNINYETQWKELLDFVDHNGKFDFCICSHTLEDIALPSVCLNMMPLVAKGGFVSTPSKYVEFSKVGGQPWLGYIHHRWIYTFKNNVYLALPKLNFIEHIPELRKLGTSNPNVSELSFFWKDDIEYKILNNDYMGPTVTDVIDYYSILFNDDFN